MSRDEKKEAVFGFKRPTSHMFKSKEEEEISFPKIPEIPSCYYRVEHFLAEECCTSQKMNMHDSQNLQRQLHLLKQASLAITLFASRFFPSKVETFQPPLQLFQVVLLFVPLSQRQPDCFPFSSEHSSVKK